MQPATTVSAALIIIGNEILSGRTQDANLAHIALTLNEVGVQLKEVRVIADLEDKIISTVNQLRGEYDYVLTTGGIGPTHDDITAACIAKAFAQKLIRNPTALQRLQQHYQEIGLVLTEARLRMANTPENATLIDNPISSAPGFRVDNVFVLAGVPKIMRAMLDHVKTQLKGGQPVLSLSINCDLGEGVIAAGLSAIQQRYQQVEIGSYPRFGGDQFRVSLVIRHPDMDLLEAVGAEIKALIHDLGGNILAPREDS